ncbi:mannitol dehydrogenase family protein [Alteromonas sp. 5E99-2]|uniref:mannitol dehydrogenase family protein n=1 Tax=Alteromonas sp. 5E99-2 TaxID=2817683 RepID=UPI001A98EDA0|nr:mannitol dehydrogenase family protein [Alteromonas sp. 5E99-2]MBO1256074.1 mannitol dehydrogenase family protein [Alteromonas sp. 5E99-2]
MQTRTNICLNNQNLHALPSAISVPAYDRSKVTSGIVHIGVGGFHRSHEAFYTDEYMAQSGDLSWGICGVGLRDADRKMQSILKEQDYLYTLIVRHPNGTIDNKVIGSLTDFLLGCDDPIAVINKMASEETKIVSLTITEGGYNFNPATGEFDFTNPDVIHDLANPNTPRLVFGFLIAALQLRFKRGLAPFTIQSCDNIQHNGDVAKKMTIAYAMKVDNELAKWIESSVSFPNAMVDRITPATTPEDIAYLNTLDLRDQWPVTCEPFHQWIIEDKFTLGRPQWEQVGAQFVNDVTPYENMKIRLLNAGHSVLGILGSLHGFSTIDESVQDPLFAEFLRLFMDLEVTPILPAVPGIDLDEYKNTLFERFSNPNIKDSLARICSESSAKLSTFMLPTIVENLAKKGEIQCATLVIAAWCLYSDKQVDLQGTPLVIADEMADEVHQFANKTAQRSDSLLELASLFSCVSSSEAFVTAYKTQVKALYNTPNIKLHMQTILRSRTSV